MWFTSPDVYLSKYCRSGNAEGCGGSRCHNGVSYWSRPSGRPSLGIVGNQICGGNSLDGRHFGLIATNFEHHGPNIFLRGYDRGSSDGVAGHLCGSACGIGRGLRDGCGHAAKSKSAGSLAPAAVCSADWAAIRIATTGVLVASRQAPAFSKKRFPKVPSQGVPRRSWGNAEAGPLRVPQVDADAIERAVSPSEAARIVPSRGTWSTPPLQSRTR
jgi:hypothetical protein